MLRNYLMIVLAIAVVAIYATTASAGNLGLVDNGDMEAQNRFSACCGEWGTPDDGDPNTPFAGSTPTGRPDAFHHSGTPTAVWSDRIGVYNPTGVPHPVTSGIHALWLEDPLFGVESEFRSFAGDSACCGGDFLGTNTGNLPGVGLAGRSVTFGWEWDYDITKVGGLDVDVFSGTIRISKGVSTDLNLDETDFTELIINTGTGSSGGYVSFSTTIALDPDDAQFDFIFNTSDRNKDKIEAGGDRETARGTMFVDDVFTSGAIFADLGPLSNINVGSKGKTPIMLQLTDVDVSTLLVGDPVLIDGGGTAVSPLSTNDSGNQTLLLVSTQEMVASGVLDGTSESLRVTGFLLDGTVFEANSAFGGSGGLAAIGSVPEPSSLILLGLGGMGLLFRRKR